MLGPQYQKLKSFNDILKPDLSVDLKPLDEYNPANKSETLSKDEILMQHISIVNGYVKSFLQIPSQTKQVTISQYDLTQEIKTLFYF